MARMMDDAQSARQPQQQDPDAEVFTTMVAGLRNHIFGKGEQGIVEQIQQADEPGRVMGEITFALVQEAAHQAESAGHELTMDILMGVATEVIDDLTQLMSAHGMDIKQQDREYALMYAQQLYVESSNPNDDDREAAKQQLAEFKQGGELDTATKYVQQRGMENGTDPFDVANMSDKPGMMGEKPTEQ